MFGTSLAIQWLRLYLPTQWGVGSIPGQGAKILYASAKKNKNRGNIVANSIKTLKMAHIKKKKEKASQSAGLCPPDQALILSHMSNRGGPKVNLC